jgi:hypothetical protein
MSRQHGTQATSWWSATAPPTNVTLSAVSWVGGVFQILAAGRICGFRVWLGGGQSMSPVFAMWDYSTDQLYTARGAVQYSGAGGWAQLWIRPWVRPTISDLVSIACVMSNEYRRQNTALASTVTHGDIAFVKSFQSTSLSPWQVSPTYNTNANGIDLLFQAD